jgi:sugar phosphate isomerase/epimerase
MASRLSQLALLLFCLAFLQACSSVDSPPSAAAPAAEPPDWRLGCQAWTFNRFSFFEAVDKVASLDLHCIEAFPGQVLEPGSEARLHHGMDKAARDRVRAKLAAADVTLAGYGVVNAGSPEEWRQIFVFAKDMGIEFISTEPGEDQLDLVESLCEEFQVKAGIHNHPKPSHYWNPDTVLAAVDGRSPLLGACADTGHWFRSGLDPVACLRKLEGRIVSLHFKDLDAGRSHDVPWGTGACNVEAMLTELDRQGLDAVFSIEYEHNWDNNIPDIVPSIAYFRDVRSRLQ